jgi:hypothetical protein
VRQIGHLGESETLACNRLASVIGEVHSPRLDGAPASSRCPVWVPCHFVLPSCGW